VISALRVVGNPLQFVEGKGIPARAECPHFLVGHRNLSNEEM